MFKLDERFTEVTNEEMMGVDGGKFNWKVLVCPVSLVKSVASSARERVKENNKVKTGCPVTDAIYHTVNITLGTVFGIFVTK